MPPPRHFAKKLTRKQKAVVPCLMDALSQAEARSVEECAERVREGEGHGG